MTENYNNETELLLEEITEPSPALIQQGNMQ